MNTNTDGVSAMSAELEPLKPAAWMEPRKHWTLEPEEWMAHHRESQHPNVKATLAAKTECLYRLTPEDVAAVNAARKERAGKALRRLDYAGGDGCFCALLPQDDLADPRPLAKAGHLVLTEDRIDPATGDGHLACTCTACGAAYLVTEVMGYHYPWYRWAPA